MTKERLRMSEIKEGMVRPRRNRKWDWEEASRLGERYGVTAGAIVSCWRDGRDVKKQFRASTAKKPHQVDLGLAVMVMVFDGFPQPRTAIADVCGVSAEAVRYIEERALRKLRIKAWDVMKEAKQ